MGYSRKRFMSYKLLSMLASGVASVLAILLITYPNVLFLLFGIEPENGAYFIGRRAAMLFLGIAILTWATRHIAHSEARQAICLSMCTSMLGLALLGTFEYLRGVAGIGIVLAVLTEVIFAILYFRIWFHHKADFLPISIKNT